MREIDVKINVTSNIHINVTSHYLTCTRTGKENITYLSYYRGRHATRQCNVTSNKYVLSVLKISQDEISRNENQLPEKTFTTMAKTIMNIFISPTNFYLEGLTLIRGGGT